MKRTVGQRSQHDDGEDALHDAHGQEEGTELHGGYGALREDFVALW